MTKKLKICMLGATGVGKTSLVARFVRSIFSDAYLTTVGVAIDKTQMKRGDDEVDLVVWDLSGEDEFQSVQLSYLRGASGYLLVVDGTRRATLSTALHLRQATVKLVGEIPVVLVVNKIDQLGGGDLEAEDFVSDAVLREAVAEAWPIVKTSAKTGDGVEEAFGRLVDEVLRSHASPAVGS